MPYERSYEIEQRLKAVLRCIATGSYSTPQIAEKLGVSVPTVSRNVLALRERGHAIRSEKRGDGWRYFIEGTTGAEKDTPQPRKGAHA
jgi:biotin operon repressor